MSVISMKQLLEAGVHFGHQTRKWNPKMKPYIFVARNDIHIINLETTSELVDKAYVFVRDVVASGKNVLFVGTKKQAQDAIKEEAERCGMFYISNRWLGGCLTNFKTILKRIERLNKLNQMEKVGEFDLLPKKEVAALKAERDKLEKNLGGIKDMREMPGVIFVVDPTVEHICVKEAKALNIPLVGLVDTNCDPSGIDYVIPGNDDAIRSVKLIAAAIADAVIEAKEGVSMKKENEDDAEETVNLEEAIKDIKIEDVKPEDKEKKTTTKKKPSKKPAVKEEKTEETAKPEKEVKEDKKETKKVVKESKKADEKTAEKKTTKKVEEKPAEKKTTKKVEEKPADKKEPAKKATAKKSEPKGDK